MRLNPPVISIAITKEHLAMLLLYCNKCNGEAFRNENDYRRNEPVREALHKFNLYAVTEKIMDKLYKHSHEKDNKLIRLKLNYSERLTFSTMFKRVEVPPALTSIEREFINQLTLTP